MTTGLEFFFVIYCICLKNNLIISLETFSITFSHTSTISTYNSLATAFEVFSSIRVTVPTSNNRLTPLKLLSSITIEFQARLFFWRLLACAPHSLQRAYIFSRVGLEQEFYGFWKWAFAPFQKLLQKHVLYLLFLHFWRQWGKPWWQILGILFLL